MCYGTGSPKDSAEYILCQKQCQCDDKSSDDQSSDGIQDVLDKIGDVDIDDWDDDIYGVESVSILCKS